MSERVHQKTEATLGDKREQKEHVKMEITRLCNLASEERKNQKEYENQAVNILRL